jgi:hypothetical protein
MFVWVMTVLAVLPEWEALTRISIRPLTVFGRSPWATARPWLSVATVRVRAPLAKLPLAPLDGSVNVTNAPATGLWFSSSTWTIGSRAVRWRMLLMAPSPSTTTIFSSDAVPACGCAAMGDGGKTNKKDRMIHSQVIFGLRVTIIDG